MPCYLSPFHFQAQFKKETGMEYKPGMAPPTTAAAPPTTGADQATCPYTRVTQQGDLVRKLKAEQAPKVPGSFIFAFSQLCVLV